MTLYIWQNPWNSIVKRVSPNVNYGFYLVILYQYWVINFLKKYLMKNINNWINKTQKKREDGNGFLFYFYESGTTLRYKVQ